MDPNVLEEILKNFAHTQEDMQLSTLRIFLFIAQRGQCNQTDVENYITNISRAAISRNVQYWTDKKADGSPGLNLVKKSVDPRDRRNNLLSLNVQGQLVYERIRTLYPTKRCN
jgi:DNA-binding MarR family transcriptional regulator